MAHVHGRKGYSPDRLYLRHGAEKIRELIGQLALGYDNSKLEYRFRCHETKASQYNVSGFEFTVSKKEGNAVHMWMPYAGVSIDIKSVWLLRYGEYVEAVRAIMKKYADMEFGDYMHEHVHYWVGQKPVEGSSSVFVYFLGYGEADDDSHLVGAFRDISEKEIAYKLKNGNIGIGADGKELRKKYDGTCFGRVEACGALLDRMTEEMFKKAVYH
jgi:hypothetical protein